MSCDMWFGTQDYAGWIQTPQTGADVTPGAWGADGVLLNGGGYAMNSFNSHKMYAFNWRTTSRREEAQLLKSYFDGTFGRGKIYFQDPLTYTTNVLPARWADPSITGDYEGQSLIPGIEPVRVRASGPKNLRLPVSAVKYDLPATGVRAKDHVFIPIPDGMMLVVGAFYESLTPDAGVYVTPVSEGGNLSNADVRVPPQTAGSPLLFSEFFSKQPGDIGVALWIGKPDSGAASSVTVNAIHARLIPLETTANTYVGENYWVGGQGNSGVRFAGPPTYINNTGRDGGQVEFAATFIESVI